MEGTMPLTDEEVLDKKYKIRDNLLELIDEITINPKPSYDIDGQQVLWADYLKLLNSSLDAIEDSIAKALPPVDGEENGYC
jgi:hypothetical protein